MGVILDEFGRKVSWKAARAAQHDSYRPWEPVERKDIADLVPSHDRQTLVSHARRIYLNLGPIKNAINQRSMYAVGRAWNPVFKGTDDAFGTEAKKWLSDIFYQIGDTRGGMHDFVTALYTWSTAVDIDGEVFILLTETKTGFPAYQGIPSHRICSPRGFMDGERYRGGMLQDGIVYYSSGAPKEYAFCDKNGELSEWIPAANIIHLFNPEWQYQGRGLPSLTACINDCRDIVQSTEFERLAMLQMSSISMVEYNERGGPDPDDPYNELAGITGTDKAVSVQSLDGGTVRYFKANSGGKIEQLKSDRPGNPFLEFHDRLLKSAFAAIEWPFAFYSGHMPGGGTAQRTEIAMAQRSIEDRQDLLLYAAKRLVSYACAKAQKRGDLPQSADWYQWAFSYPAKLTIDDGRVIKELETGWKMGSRNMREIVGMQGRNLEDHYRERAEEIAIRKIAKAEAEQKYGVEIEDREMAMLTANEQPQQEANTDQSDGR